MLKYARRLVAFAVYAPSHLPFKISPYASDGNCTRAGKPQFLNFFTHPAGAFASCSISGVRRIFQWGSVTSHRDDVKILHYNYSSLEVLKCIALKFFQPKLQLTMINLYKAITKETTNIFHSHFCLMLCVSCKERKGFTETQAVRPWLKFF